jgi:aconitate hydratase
LKGDERVTIPGRADVKPRQVITITVTRADGTVVPVPVLCRIDTLDEIEYFKNGGILHYVLRNLAA